MMLLQSLKHQMKKKQLLKQKNLLQKLQQLKTLKKQLKKFLMN